MKIGVLLTIYNCDEYVEECLNPWFELKKEHEVVISAVSGMFSDYRLLGLPNRNKKTLEKLLNYDINFQITTNGEFLLGEDESRNLCLNFLKNQNCDLIWILDGDEAYTKKQLTDIIKFIEENSQYDIYEVNFKNLTIYKNLFMEYRHKRIFWANRHDGIDKIYFDNQFFYNNGTDINSVDFINVPRKIAYIKHYSWLSDDSRTKDKITYQKYRYRFGGGKENNEDLRCSYIWNQEIDRLDFNKIFYNNYNQEIPCLHEEISCFSTKFDIDYSRFDKCFYIKNIYEDMNVEFKIYNGVTDDHIYTTFLNLVKGVNFYMAPFYEINDDFINFRIEAYENGFLIHNEKIYLKL